MIQALSRLLPYLAVRRPLIFRPGVNSGGHGRFARPWVIKGVDGLVAGTGYSAIGCAFWLSVPSRRWSMPGGAFSSLLERLPPVNAEENRTDSQAGRTGTCWRQWGLKRASQSTAPAAEADVAGSHPSLRTVSVTGRRPKASASWQLHMYRSTCRPLTAGPVSSTV